MKLRKVTKKEKSDRTFDGSWTASRERFLELKPLDLSRLSDNIMFAPKSHRPYLCKTAKEEGAEYFTLPVSDERIILVRIKPPTEKQKGK